MLVKKCPLCGSKNGKFFHMTADRLLREYVLVVFVVCRDCGLVFQVDRMSDDEMRTYYESQYRETVQGTSAITSRVKKEQSTRGKLLLEQIRPHIKEVKSALDIGASTGLWLQILQAEYGCDIQGVEPHIGFRQSEETKNIPIVKDIKDLPDKKYDLITIIHTLEHLANPFDLLDEIRERFAKKDTRLIVEVPDLYNEHACRLSHPLIFTRKTIKELLQLAGWRVDKLWSYRGIKKQKANILAICTPGDYSSKTRRVPWWWVKARYLFGQWRLRR